jgi:hypothetical protein
MSVKGRVPMYVTLNNVLNVLCNPELPTSTVHLIGISKTLPSNGLVTLPILPVIRLITVSVIVI